MGVVGSLEIVEGADEGGATVGVAPGLSVGEDVELSDSVGVVDADAASPECRRSPTANASHRPAPAPAITTTAVNAARCHEPAIADHTDVRQFIAFDPLPS